MLREVFRDTAAYTHKSDPSYQVAERYQVRCGISEAISRLAEMQLRKNVEDYNSDVDCQISALSSLTAHILERSGASPQGNTMNINGQLWEDPRGLTNQIVGHLEGEKIDWRARSWLTNLLTDKFDPQRQLESASKLGFIPEDLDPYVLKDALFRWKMP